MNRRNKYGQFAKAKTPTAKRDDRGQFVRPPSRRVLSASWAGVIVSLGLLWLCTSMVEASLGAFRSCSTNNNGVTLSNCGKASLNPGDFILIGLFILAACLTLSLATHAWRMTRKVMP